MLPFKEWPKIHQLNNTSITITEKIDGANACVQIIEGAVVGAQNRKRIITPDDDNYGFAQWCVDNSDELSVLGNGYHYGEWAGPGIQKNPHELTKKCFFLFNTRRWSDPDVRPICCDVAPVLYQGPWSEEEIEKALQDLHENGTKIGPGGGRAEGIVIYYRNEDRMAKYHLETYRALKELE